MLESVVYCTTNLINGKKYIGSDSNNDKYYYGSGINLKKAIKKYGKSNFRKEILWIGPLEYLREIEVYWCEYFDVEHSQLFYNCTNKGIGSIKGVPKPSAYKPVLQYDFEGNFIKEWESYTLIVKETGITNVACTITGKDSSAGGFLWKQKIGNNIPDKIEPYKDKRLTGKKVLQLDLEGNIINEFDSMWIAGKMLNLQPSCIRRAIIQSVKAYNYFWKLKQ